jgi:hypothetical protein
MASFRQEVLGMYLDKLRGDDNETPLERSLHPILKTLRQIFKDNGYSTGIFTDNRGVQFIDVETWNRKSVPNTRQQYEISWSPSRDRLIVNQSIREFPPDMGVTKLVTKSSVAVTAKDPSYAAQLVLRGLKAFEIANKTATLEGDELGSGNKDAQRILKARGLSW